MPFYSPVINRRISPRTWRQTKKVSERGGRWTSPARSYVQTLCGFYQVS